MIDLVHPNQSGRELEHVVAQRDDDKLGILGTLLNIARNNGDLWLLLADIIQNEAVTRNTYISEV